MNKLLYRPKEAAQMLGIGRDKLYDLMRSGRLHSVKDGRARFITATALAGFDAAPDQDAWHPELGVLRGCSAGWRPLPQRENADVGFLVEGEANGDRMPGLASAGPGWW